MLSWVLSLSVNNSDPQRCGFITRMSWKMQLSRPTSNVSSKLRHPSIGDYGRNSSSSRCSHGGVDWWPYLGDKNISSTTTWAYLDHDTVLKQSCATETTFDVPICSYRHKRPHTAHHKQPRAFGVPKRPHTAQFTTDPTKPLEILIKTNSYGQRRHTNKRPQMVKNDLYCSINDQTNLSSSP